MWRETQPTYFVRTGLTRWIVPVDDTNTLYIAWRHFNDGDGSEREGPS